jgi:aquaporin Z
LLNFSAHSGLFSEVAEVQFSPRRLPASNGQLGILLGVALAFGLTVLTMAYAVGHISGGHFNPAVSVGLLAGGRFSAKDLVPYVVAQCLERLQLQEHCIHSERFRTPDFSDRELLPPISTVKRYFGKSYSMSAAFLTEFLLTAFFLIIILVRQINLPTENLQVLRLVWD